MPGTVLVHVLQMQLLTKVIALDSMSSLFSKESIGVVSDVVEVCLVVI